MKARPQKYENFGNDRATPPSYSVSRKSLAFAMKRGWANVVALAKVDREC